MANSTSFSSLQAALEALRGPGVSIVSSQRIWGGDINDAARLTLSDGTDLFMKSNTLANEDFFRAELEGLAALRKAGPLPVPEPFCRGRDQGRKISFLLMEYVPSGPRRKDYWEQLGRGLALLHRASPSFLYDKKAGPLYGFPRDNYIGASPQINTWKCSWPDFFAACRLEPQIRMAYPALPGSVRKDFSRLLDHMDQYLPEPSFPSLLHGDLWSGNVMGGKEGRAMIMDPAAYVGSSEADLAMTSLFGGFPQAFYRAYAEVSPPAPEYSERRELYNLYHLLNHLNLFGESYYYEVLSVLRRY